MLAARLSRSIALARSAARRNYADPKIVKKRETFFSNPTQGADNPTYLKMPSDVFNVVLAFAGIGAGIYGLACGLYDMTYAVNKKQA